MKFSDERGKNQPRNFDRSCLNLNRILDKLTKEEKKFILNQIERDPLKDLYNRSLAVYMLSIDGVPNLDLEGDYDLVVLTVVM